MATALKIDADDGRLVCRADSVSSVREIRGQPMPGGGPAYCLRVTLTQRLQHGLSHQETLRWEQTEAGRARRDAAWMALMGALEGRSVESVEGEDEAAEGDEEGGDW